MSILDTTRGANVLRKTVLALGLVLSVCSIMLPLATRAPQPAIPVIGFLSIE